MFFISGAVEKDTEKNHPLARVAFSIVVRVLSPYRGLPDFHLGPTRPLC
jgi:hypothetical protein